MNSKEWNLAHPERMKAAAARWRERNPIQVFANTHGLDFEDAAIILANKPDRCEICGRYGRICYDHNHETDEHRGWLCHGCNAAIGALGDDIEGLERALEYLRRHHADGS